MEIMDARKAARVWERVRSTAPVRLSAADLQAMLTEERSSAAICLMLSQRLTGKNGELLRRMSEEALSHAACLRGMFALTEGGIPEQPRISLPREPLETVLRSCYGREMRALAAYESRASDPEYGPVFARMAGQEQLHCRYLLEIIGKINH